MQTINLGINGPAVAPLGLGTWSWGDTLFWDYGRDFGPEEVAQAFAASLDVGVALIDTAEIYGFGESERLIGQFCQGLAQPVQIATKYFPLPWRWQRSDITKALTASLERLQMSQICLYQIHWPLEFWLKTPDFMAVLATEVKQGRIQAVGVSNYSAPQMEQAHQCLAAHGIPLASNQVPYSLLNRGIERNGILDKARQLNVTVLAYSPLAQGLLTGKYRPNNPINLRGARRLDPRFTPKGLNKLQPLIAMLEELGAKYGKTPAQVSLNWLMTQGNVIPIPGAKTADQARQNGGALGWQLTPEDRALLANMASSVE